MLEKTLSSVLLLEHHFFGAEAHFSVKINKETHVQMEKWIPDLSLIVMSYTGF